ncbi:transcriptional regulator PpsR [Limimaricola pyoseonensis]|uniref:Transcriptional regulator PpsR n=1 Tax=Limimaricola pyoseonensis TaxID=521013 RepID=A0A1G7B061_9RHOB|nr:transcriptional regulator PpsR [Limimaricola pyoseonensis]SDE20237.1 transcriptional regulator PpsR [Limimaricola pyoseonensis]
MTEHSSPYDALLTGVLAVPEGLDSIVADVADIAISIDAQNVIRGIAVNPERRTLGRLDHWVGRDFGSFLTVESREKFQRRIRSHRAGEGGGALELNHLDNASWGFPVRYSLHDVGETVLLLGRDLQAIAELQQRLVREQIARERDQERARGRETRYRVVLEASETPILVIDPEAGRIEDLNGAAALLLGARRDALQGSAVAQAFEGRRRGEFTEALRRAAADKDAPHLEALARRSGRALRLVPELFRASGDMAMLVRLQPVADEERGGSELSDRLAALWEAGPDAVVFTDVKGVIRDANEAFLTLADAAQPRDVQGRPLSDFLARGGVDLKLLLDNTLDARKLRNYAAQLEGVVGTRVAVEIAVARLGRRGEDGLGFVIRDVSAREEATLDEAGAAMSPEAMKNVMDLVGTAPLKDLVAATTDVVEKLCIETAVQLTNNNRVAAAEMLGLSRQSLYVKLRKYGLIDSSGDS